jgi:hypothetical protein
MGQARSTEDSPNFGTYEKDGQTKVAQSLDHAVKYEFDGWSKTGDAEGDALGTDTAAVSSTASKPAKSAPAKTGDATS